MIDRLIRELSLRDVFWVIVGSIAIVGFWRGTWNLLDAYLFPESFLLSQVVSILCGILILIVLSRYR